MLLATHIKDMTPEELLSLIQPFLYLIPITLVIIAIIIGVKIYQALAVKRMLAYMQQKGLSVAEKRDYLTNYLMRASQKDLVKHIRPCPVCGKKYSLKKQSENKYGDLTEEWNHDGCTFCHTKVYLQPEEHYQRHFAIKRTPTNSPKEKQWKNVFTQVENYIDIYKPYIDCTPDSSGNKITIDISFH